MMYRISHITRYHYGDTASLSHNELFLTPRDTVHQRCLTAGTTLTPVPSTVTRRKDYFGNTVISTTVQVPHSSLVISAVSQVDLTPPPLPMPERTPPWEQVKETLWQHSSPEDLNAFQFIFPSPMIPSDQRFAAMAREAFQPGVPILKGALALTRTIFTGFAYDPQATTAATPVETAFDLKRGVCQDFAHIGIACLRSLGLAARYVSGYLHTLPPPGKPRLIGADASHAWLSIYITGTGWIDLDPTNNVLPSDQHLTLAWGRDYSDVTPVRGTVLGGGQHQLSVAVDVSRTEDDKQTRT
ncbi:MAG: transglutaminase family protein [Pseudomonadota bacterium]